MNFQVYFLPKMLCSAFLLASNTLTKRECILKVLAGAHNKCTVSKTRLNRRQLVSSWVEIKLSSVLALAVIYLFQLKKLILTSKKSIVIKMRLTFHAWKMALLETLISRTLLKVNYFYSILLFSDLNCRWYLYHHQVSIYVLVNL